MFIDDDFYLNPKKLMNYLKTEITESKYENLFGGYVFPSSRPMRHINSKWYITLQEYPYHKFPPFVAVEFVWAVVAAVVVDVAVAFVGVVTAT